METDLLLARAVLAAVFLVSGITKLADLEGSRQTLIDFGLPGRLAGPASLALPPFELLLALSLLPVMSAWYAAVGVLALLALFVTAIAVNLIQGNAPDCHCFGQLHSEPIGWRILARNGALAAIAAFVAWQGYGRSGASIVTLFITLTRIQQLALVGLLAGLAAVSVLLWLLYLLWQQLSRMKVRLDGLEANLASGSPARTVSSALHGSSAAGLPIGSRAPGFALEGLTGGTHTLGSLLASEKPLLLLFTHPRCEPCQELMPAIGKWQQDHSADLNIALISEGSLDDNRTKAEEHGISQILLQKKREVAEAYKASATPAGIIVEPDGTIGSSVALGLKATWELFARRLGIQGASILPALSTPGLPEGTAAPAFELPCVDGRLLSLETLLAAGKPLLLAFTNPDWPPSQGLLEDMSRWQREHIDSLNIAVISAGSIQSRYAQASHHGLTHVLLQEKSEVAEAYGAFGTPAAVVVQPDGTIGSAMALGAEEIRNLVSHTNAPRESGGTAAPPSPAMKKGELPPPLTFKDLDGNSVSLASFRGDPTLLLFWSPSCGFCRGMLSDLKAWEANPPQEAPRVLVISSGSVEANRSVGLRSAVVLDDGFRAGAAFGARGTPMALLLDEQGRVASEVVAGAEAVLDLAGAPAAAMRWSPPFPAADE